MISHTFVIRKIHNIAQLNRKWMSTVSDFPVAEYTKFHCDIFQLQLSRIPSKCHNHRDHRRCRGVVTDISYLDVSPLDISDQDVSPRTFWTWTFCTQAFRHRSLDLDVSHPGRFAPDFLNLAVSAPDILDLEVPIPDIPEQDLSD